MAASRCDVFGVCSEVSHLETSDPLSKCCDVLDSFVACSRLASHEVAACRHDVFVRGERFGSLNRRLKPGFCAELVLWRADKFVTLTCVNQAVVNVLLCSVSANAELHRRFSYVVGSNLTWRRAGMMHLECALR